MNCFLFAFQLKVNSDLKTLDSLHSASFSSKETSLSQLLVFVIQEANHFHYLSLIPLMLQLRTYYPFQSIELVSLRDILGDKDCAQMCNRQVQALQKYLNQIPKQCFSSQQQFPLFCLFMPLLLSMVCNLLTEERKLLKQQFFPKSTNFLSLLQPGQLYSKKCSIPYF